MYSDNSPVDAHGVGTATGLEIRVEQSPFHEPDSFDCVHVLICRVPLHKKVGTWLYRLVEVLSVCEYVVLLVTVAAGIVVDVNEVLQYASAFALLQVGMKIEARRWRRLRYRYGFTSSALFFQIAVACTGVFEESSEQREKRHRRRNEHRNRKLRGHGLFPVALDGVDPSCGACFVALGWPSFLVQGFLSIRVGGRQT